MRVKTVDDLLAGPLHRLLTADKLGYLPDRGWNVEGPLSEPMGQIKRWAENASDEGRNITDKQMWKWTNAGEDEDQESWQRSNSKWREVIRTPYRLREKANASWGVSWDTSTENVDHLFYNCSEVRSKWEMLVNLHNRVTGSTFTSTSLLTLLEYSLKPENIALATAAILMLRQTWKGRCKQVYEGRAQPIMMDVILSEADRMVANLKKDFTSTRKCELLQNCHKTLTLMRWHISRYNGSMLPDQNWLGIHGSEEEWPHISATASEDRRTNRADAADGCHPKERSATSGTMSLFSPTYDQTEPGEPPSIPTDVSSMLRELQLLGFEEFRTEDNQNGSPMEIES
ncbi:hypothetical protein R1sor_025203 [Riccia sorocarpa]|uniref:Reverse transcriptase zinc-binding domain-containing protein n=1 Tax=Riccia sorocarpa TaxID=122646 RepID=A0ABD3G7Y1_9MARC